MLCLKYEYQMCCAVNQSHFLLLSFISLCVCVCMVVDKHMHIACILLSGVFLQRKVSQDSGPLGPFFFFFIRMKLHLRKSTKTLVKFLRRYGTWIRVRDNIKKRKKEIHAWTHSAYLCHFFNNVSNSYYNLFFSLYLYIPCKACLLPSHYKYIPLERIEV